MIPTLGRRHPTIRRLRALRRDPVLRRQQSVFLAEGVHLALEALRNDADVELVVFSERLSANEEGRDLLRTIEQRALPAVETADAVLDSLQDARSSQPILTLVRRRSWPAQAGLHEAGIVPLVVAAFGVQDPGNLGGLLRTADAAGVTAFFVAQGSVDPFHPRAVRAAMGSIFRIPVHVEPEDAVLLRLRERGLRLIATDPAGALDYVRCDFVGPVAVLFGGEGPGLSAALRGRTDESIRIPMRPEMNSLSVGAAAAVVLFEAARQRRDAGEAQPSAL